MHFPLNKIAIVGVGLIGGSFGMAVRELGIADYVIGLGRNPEKLERAKNLNAIDEWSTDIKSALQDADLVYLATPVNNIIDFIREHAGSFKRNCIVTDAGSTKEEICDAAKEFLPDNVHFIGGHPMAGSEMTGVEFARSDLFNNAAYILTQKKSTDIYALDIMKDIVKLLGSRLIELDASAHDKCVSVISHLPHIIAASLIHMVDQYAIDHPYIYQLISGSFRDMTRVAGSSPEIWRDICVTNSENIKYSASIFKKCIDEGVCLTNKLNANDFELWFKNAKISKENNITKK